MPWLIVHILCPLFVLVDDYHRDDDDDDCVQVIQWLLGNMVVASSGPGPSNNAPRKENITHNAMQLLHLTAVVGCRRLGAGWLVARHSGS